MIRGERFELDLGSDDERDDQNPVLPAAFVGDILERKPSATAAKPPTAPSLKTKTGFPEHKKRNVPSRFKQQKNTSPSSQDEPSREPTSDIQATASEKFPPPAGASDPPPTRQEPLSWDDSERIRIDRENQQRLADMTPAQIEEERHELMESLSPAFVQRLLQRPSRQNGEQMQKMLRQADIGSGSNESDFYGAASTNFKQATVNDGDESAEKKQKPAKTVSFAETPAPAPIPKPEPLPDHENPIEQTPEPPTPSTQPPDNNSDDTIHFPLAPQPPSLDPTSATFLTDLHEKYFPSLPSDPSKLTWMQPPTEPNTYSPTNSAFAAKDLRFAFTGALLAPSLSASIPVTAGLHHHGDSPDAAGYTIPELTHLARSTYAAQRCIAFQTLGRILFRLGKGEFGDAGEPHAEEIGAEPLEMKGELARGLWALVEREKAVEILVAESEGNGVDGGRHVSAKAYATEAVWLWQKGGGRRWKAA